MAQIINHVLKRSLIASRMSGISLVQSRNCGWVQDWKPGPYPKTKEEKERAAKRYNLLPEDYEPYPEGSGYGDYPKLPEVGQEGRDPYERFDYHYRRRNFGETLHVDYDIFTSDRVNPNVKLRYSKLFMVSTFCGAVSLMFLMALIDYYGDLRNAYPMKPKQYPAPGVIHYTFEPCD